MTKKGFVGRLLLIFILCLMGFAFVKSVKETKGEQVPVVTPAVQTTSYANEVADNEAAKPNVDTEKSEDIKTNTEATTEPTVDKQDIEDRIEAYLQEEKVVKARSLYEQYEDLGLKGSLLKDINTLEMDLVLNATEEAKAVYFEKNDIVAAKDIITACEKKVGTSNEKLNEYKNIFDSCKEVRMTNLDYVECGTSPKKKSSIKDVFGNTYSDGFYMDAEPYFDNVYGIYYVDNLDVNAFKATITPSDHLSASESHPFIIKVKTMDAERNVTTVYETPAMSLTTLPIDVCVDIGDAPFVVISCSRGSDISGPLGGAFIVNPVLFNKLTEDDFDLD